MAAGKAKLLLGWVRKYNRCANPGGTGRGRLTVCRGGGRNPRVRHRRLVDEIDQGECAFYASNGL